jgi:S1-C subfamily serine protease
MFWFRKAAEQGLEAAQFELAKIYAIGKTVPKDEQQAAMWLRKAAERGYVKAQSALSFMYQFGNGVTKDLQQAGGWLRRAAVQGDIDSQIRLGAMYANGIVFTKDEQMAYFWWLLASAQGNQEAVGFRDFVERGLSAEQRTQAQAKARDWRPKAAAQSLGGLDGIALEGGGSVLPSSPQAPTAASPDSSGSGFRVARGAIVTNHHVIEGCSRLSVNGTTAVVSGSDARSDLALLSATLPGPSVNLRVQRAAVGEPVAVAGFPLRGLLSGFNTAFGNVTSLSGAGGDTRLMQISAPVQPGNSGGPVVDSAGNLMGVVVSKLDALKTAKLTGDVPQNVNFAINTNVLRSFLDANGVNYEDAKSSKQLAQPAVAEKAKGFSVLVECWK